MPKTVSLDPHALQQLAEALAARVCARLQLPPPGEQVMPEPMRVMIELRTCALHAALQCQHDPQHIVAAAQRFVTFLQLGT